MAHPLRYFLNSIAPLCGKTLPSAPLTRRLRDASGGDIFLQKDSAFFIFLR